MATPRVTIDQLPEQGAPEDTNMIVIQDAGVTKKMSLATLKQQSSTLLDSHLTDATDAHDASAISATPSGAGVDGTTVQGQLGQLAGLVDAIPTTAENDAHNDTRYVNVTGDAMTGALNSNSNIATSATVIGNFLSSTLDVTVGRDINISGKAYLTSPAAPTDPSQVVRKDYVDAAVAGGLDQTEADARYLKLTGGDLTGNLSLFNGDIAILNGGALGVDGPADIGDYLFVAGPMSTNETLTVGHDPIANLDVATKQYVDTKDTAALNAAGAAYAPRASLYLPGTAGNYVSAPDAAGLDILGDITIVARIAANDWSPGASKVIAAKDSANGARSYRFFIEASGALSWAWSVDGTTVLTAFASANLAALADGSWKWVAITFDVDNGASGRSTRFWISDDGATWTQVGTTQTNAGVTSIFSSAAPVSIGARDVGTVDLFAGKVSYVSIRNGIGASGVVGGTEVYQWRADPMDQVNRDAYGNVSTVNGTGWQWRDTNNVVMGAAGPSILYGVGMPEAVVTAPVGTEYVDTVATSGAVKWIKATGTGNTGWRVVYGDTGWRGILEWNSAGTFTTGTGFVSPNIVPRAGSAGFVRIRRINDTVRMAFSNAQTSAAGMTASTAYSIVTLPVAGWINAGTSNTHRQLVAAAGGHAIQFSFNGDIQYIPGAALAAGVVFTNQFTVLMPWLAPDAWPTTLPGIAIAS